MMRSLALFIAVCSYGCSVDSSIPLGSGDGGSDTDGEASAAVCPLTFSACGGDLAGTWSLVEMCGARPAPEMCETAETIISFMGTDTTSFEAGSMVTTKMATYVYTTDVTSCLGGAEDETCESIGMRSPLQTCAPTDAGTEDCVCTWSAPVDDTSTYEYSVSGSTLLYGGFAAVFCVDGDVLSIALPDESDEFALYVRQ